GSGGITGVAWEIGMLAGLAERGVDLTTADLVIGTSAGAVVGAQVTSPAPLTALYEAQLGPPDATVAARMGLWVKLRFVWALACCRDPARSRLRLGRLALATPSVPEAQRREVIEARLPSRDWPEQRLLITAVGADSGEFAVFDAASGVSLADAVAASCAVPGIWPPVLINGRRWMDGGMRSVANADLAADCDQIVVLAPIPQGFGTMPPVARQCVELAHGGRAVAMVAPDQASVAAIGKNLLDPAQCAAAAAAGHAQAAAAADDLARLWSAGPPGATPASAPPVTASPAPIPPASTPTASVPPASVPPARVPPQSS
ncbi:MAG TPA: patatin-like phospholipase family protein, partial [Streptosporangiaceae bacterium]